MAATEGLLASLEQLAWLLWETASGRPFYFLMAFILPLIALAIFCVGIALPLRPL
jgi:dolichyl-phosphate beta-glucosyltransferase